MFKNYKVFDCHAHAYPPAIAQRAAQNVSDFYEIPVIHGGSFDDLYKMEQQCCEGFMMFAAAMNAAQVTKANDYIMDVVKKFSSEELRIVAAGTIHQDFEDKDSLIDRLYLSEARSMLAGDTLSKGMIPKIQACTQALGAGVSRAHILNGTLPHSLLLELFTDEGVGTMILADRQDEVPEDFTEYPVGNLASKLHG